MIMSTIKPEKIVNKYWCYQNTTSKYCNHENHRQSISSNCNKFDICKIDVIFNKTFKCTVTGQVYYIKDESNCESNDTVCLITFLKCLEQSIGFAINFKNRFGIHKTDKFYFLTSSLSSIDCC